MSGDLKLQCIRNCHVFYFILDPLLPDHSCISGELRFEQRISSSKIYHVVQKSEASAYFCLYLLIALTKSNNFLHTYAAFYNELLNYIYSYSLEGATKMKQLFPLPRLLTGSFIRPL